MNATLTAPDKNAKTLPMTTDMFLEELALLALTFDWHLSFPTRYESDRPEGSANIRCTFEDVTYCPITAMAMAKTGRIFGMKDWDAARDCLGMDHEEAMIIAEAADSPYSHTMELVDLHNQMRTSLGI